MTSSFDDADRRFMKEALQLAENGIGLSSPNPNVGCVVVCHGRVVGQGWHEYELRDHAEVRALRMAGDAARGATVYVTLEPCCHHGRTPPCTDALIQAGVRRVVVGRMDPNPVVAGCGVEQLRSAGLQVDVGLMEAAAGGLIEAFACQITTGLPLVVAKAGMSLDGRIGSGAHERCPISSAEGMAYGQHLRLSCDAILVGIKTLLADDPELTCRSERPKARPLVRVILDTRLRTSPDARLFQVDPKAPVLLFCGPDAAPARRIRLEKAGAEVLPVSLRGGRLNLFEVLCELGRRRILGLLVEGGGEIHWSFIESGLVDVFHFIVAPMVLGGRKAIPVVGGEGYKAAADALRFIIRRTIAAGPDMVMEAYPQCSRSILSPWRESMDISSSEQDSSCTLTPGIGKWGCNAREP